MNRNISLGLNLTPDLVNDFFRLNTNPNRPPVAQPVRHHVGQGGVTSRRSGTATPGCVSKSAGYEQQLTLAYDEE